MMERRDLLRRLLLTPLGAALLAGCTGEREAPIIPSSKPKDDLQKDLENPYGGPVKEGKAKRKR